MATEDVVLSDYTQYGQVSQKVRSMCKWEWDDKIVAVDAWNHSYFLCKNYILNGHTNTLYTVYSEIKTTKQLWETLEYKYKTEDTGTKKFVVAIFLKSPIVDAKPVISQVDEYQMILHGIHAEGTFLFESFQVAPSWKDFRSYLKHKKKEITIEDLISKPRIEEDNSKADCWTWSQEQ